MTYPDIPEAITDLRVIDRFGDAWAEGADGRWWSPETAPFPLEHVDKKWGPLTSARITVLPGAYCYVPHPGVADRVWSTVERRWVAAMPQLWEGDQA